MKGMTQGAKVRNARLRTRKRNSKYVVGYVDGGCIYGQGEGNNAIDNTSYTHTMTLLQARRQLRTFQSGAAIFELVPVAVK